MTKKSPSIDKRRPAIFVQTDVKVHEAWASLSLKNPRASAMMHLLVSMMKQGDDAVVISQKILAERMQCHTRTIARGVKALETLGYLQVIKLGTGNLNAYIINEKVSWTDERKNMRYASFRANVIADVEDQSPLTLARKKLNALPVITPPDEVAVPLGEGKRDSQISLPSLESTVTRSE